MVSNNRIAFGSCNEQDRQNKMWPIIEKRGPAAFIFGGDAIYGDYDLPTDWTKFLPETPHVCADPARLRNLYKKQKAVPGYKSLLKSNMTIFGSFDDHDYGCNNADKTFEHRYEAGLEFVEFLGQPADSPMSRRAQAGMGVYGVKLFDFARPKGQQEVPDEEALIDPHVLDNGNATAVPVFPAYSNQSVAVFVLDVRSNKSPWKQGSAAYIPDFEGDMLGEDQWQWFEAAISRSRAAVNVVVSGLQHHANIFPEPNIAESWTRFPSSQQRLFDAMLQDGVQAPILVSGDVHMSQLMRKDCARIDGTSKQRRSLVEMTTSGMTHSWGTVSSPPLSNPNEKPSLQERYKSFAARVTMHVLHAVSPWTDLLVSQPSTEEATAGLFPNGGGEGAKDGLQYSLEKNFGELEFDWENRRVSMRSFGETPGTPPLLMASWTLDQLSGHDSIPGSVLTSQNFVDQANLHAPRFTKNGGEWMCLAHRGTPSLFWQMAGHVSTVGGLSILLPFPMLVPTLLLAMMFFRKPRTGLASSKRRI
ncbi:PhoD-like phosphatase [Seminavis robusta]|uniref:PhoD-like phosphatase n=1 Tax=Seminavis robusta TaxID=568900 RepID=A0A9N8D9L0_9STRA|nr:PhoD-like phosphatase [Seminavis robusta]|eukprot:Sro5_g004340.1 PhoD-like phosphatase (531) ;mRNA; r:128783-130560